MPGITIKGKENLVALARLNTLFSAGATVLFAILDHIYAKGPLGAPGHILRGSTIANAMCYVALTRRHSE